MDFSPDKLKARLAELNPLVEAAEGDLAPLRAELAGIVAGDTKLSVKAANAREAVIRSEIKEKQAALFPLEQERAVITRALGGKRLGE